MGNLIRFWATTTMTDCSTWYNVVSTLSTGRPGAGHPRHQGNRHTIFHIQVGNSFQQTEVCHIRTHQRGVQTRQSQKGPLQGNRGRQQTYSSD